MTTRSMARLRNDKHVIDCRLPCSTRHALQGNVIVVSVAIKREPYPTAEVPRGSLFKGPFFFEVAWGHSRE